MSKLDDLDLPELPEGHRWRVKNDTLIGEPILRLERRGWFGWRKIGDRFISYSVWGNMDTAIRRAAQEIMQSREAKRIVSQDYLGTKEY